MLTGVVITDLQLVCESDLEWKGVKGNTQTSSNSAQVKHLKVNILYVIA
jgi:hypothetical protein